MHTDEKAEVMFKGRKISSLTDEELISASFELDGMLERITAQRAEPSFKKRMQKLGKIMDREGKEAGATKLPALTINPAIAELQKSINIEIQKRKG